MSFINSRFFFLSNIRRKINSYTTIFRCYVLFQVRDTMDMLTCQYVKLPEESSLPSFFNLTSYVTGSLKVNRSRVSARAGVIVIVIVPGEKARADDDGARR